MLHKLSLPSQIIYGEGSLDQLVNLVKNKNISHPSVFTDTAIMNTGILQKTIEIFNKEGLDTVVFSNIPAEPTAEQANTIIQSFKQSKCDGVIAIGGGSVMDVAKLAALLGNSDTTVEELLDNPICASRTITLIMVPTTAGTGSEATPNAIVAIPEKELKVGIVNESMLADYVILDPTLLDTVPKHIAASTGIDALAHAIECYTSNKANVFSDLYAMEAMKLIFSSIEDVYFGNANATAKSNMLLAAFYGGVAIYHSGTTAVHALAYPLGGKYRIPHGVSNAMLLAPIMKFNMDCCTEKLANVYDSVCKQKQEGLSLAEKAEWVVERISNIVTNLNIPQKLTEFDVNKTDIDSLSISGFGVKRLLNNNCKEMTLENVKAIYEQLF